MWPLFGYDMGDCGHFVVHQVCYSLKNSETRCEMIRLPKKAQLPLRSAILELCLKNYGYPNMVIALEKLL